MKKLFNIISILTTAGIVFWIGINASDLIDSVIDMSEPLELYLLHILMILVFFYAAIYLHLILHEGGHLVFGLAGGYRFVSFRILNYALIRQNGVIRKKKYSVAGTAGQCLMAPPRDRTALFPFVIYNLGGVTMNLLTAALCWFLFRHTSVNMLRAFFLMMIFAGILLALSNGVPLSTSTVNNDGWNAVSGCINLNARRAFNDVLEINALQSDNIRYKDMDPSLFWMPEEKDRQNTLCAIMVLMCESRMMDEHRFEETEILIRELLAGGYALPQLYYPLLKCDLVYIDILYQKNPDEPRTVMAGRKTKKILQTMATAPSVLRTNYSYEKYVLHSDVSHILAAYEKSRTVYPYLGEFESEDELIALLDQTLAPASPSE